jgi:hypothetical protein
VPLSTETRFSSFANAAMPGVPQVNVLVELVVPRLSQPFGGLAARDVFDTGTRPRREGFNWFFNKPTDPVAEDTIEANSAPWRKWGTPPIDRSVDRGLILSIFNNQPLGWLVFDVLAPYLP